MNKTTYNEIKRLEAQGQDDDVIQSMITTGYQPTGGEAIAYYTPSTANWSWQVGVYKIDGELYELLTRFGAVHGGRKLYLYDNKREG